MLCYDLENLLGRTPRASWHEELGEGPCALLDPGGQPSAQQDVDHLTLLCPGPSAYSLISFSPSRQLSFIHRPVLVLVLRSPHSFAQLPAGLSLLLPEGEHEKQLSALTAASFTLLPSACFALFLLVSLLCSEAA